MMNFNHHGDSFFDYEYLREFEAEIERLEM